MILRRAVRGLGEERPIEQLDGPELRAWILELRSTLSTISVAGYVRTLKVLGNWLAPEELAPAAALQAPLRTALLRHPLCRGPGLASL